MADISGLTPTQKVTRTEANFQTIEDFLNDPSLTISTEAANTIKTIAGILADADTAIDRLSVVSFALEATLLADLAYDSPQLAYAVDTESLFVKEGASGAGQWRSIDFVPPIEVLTQNVSERFRYIDDDAPRVSGDIYAALTTVGGASTSILDSNSATLLIGNRDNLFIEMPETATLIATDSVTCVVRVLAGELNAAPNVWPLDVNRSAVGTNDTMVLQADGSYQGTVTAAVSGKVATGLRVQTDARNSSVDVKIEIYAFKGTTVPEFVNVPNAVTVAIANATADMMTETEIKALIDDRGALVAQLALGDGALAAKIQDEIAFAAETKAFANALTGDDANDGSRATPVETAGQAASLSSVVALASSQVFPTVNNAITFGSGSAGGVGSYGSGSRKPIIDGRQNLNGKTWTQIGSTDAWETTVTLEADFLPGGTTASSTHLMVYERPDADKDFIGTRLSWVLDEGSIAANETAVGNTPGSFCANIVGETDPDPRFGTSTSRNLRIVVHRFDSADPNGTELLITSASSVAFFGGQGARNMITVGNFGKDAAYSSVSGTGANTVFPEIRDYEHYEGCAHGLVNLGYPKGTYVSRGRKIDGSAVPYSGGAGWVFFTETDYSVFDIDLILDADFDISGHLQAIYSHGLGIAQQPNIWRRIYMPEGARIKADNCSRVFDFVQNVSTDIRTRNCIATNCRSLVRCGQGGQYWLHTGGSWEGTSDPISQEAFINFDSPNGGTFELRDFDFTFNSPTGVLDLGAGNVSVSSFLLSRSGGGSIVPKVIFRNCRDLTQWRRNGDGTEQRKGFMRRGNLNGVSASLIDVEVRDGSQLGDLMDQSGGTNYPNSLIVEAGCQVGLGDRTRAEIVADMTAAGRTVSIDSGATIVGRDGQVIDPAV